MFAVCETLIEAPVPINVPPQEPLNHFHVAPVPNEPPFTLSVKLTLAVANATEEVMEVGAVLTAFTVGVTLAEVPEQPAALVTVTDTGVALLTEIVCVVAPVDQRYEAYPAPASSVVEPPAQNASVPLMVGVGKAFTVVLTDELVPAQPAALVTVTDTEVALLTEIVCVVAPVDHR